MFASVDTCTAAELKRFLHISYSMCQDRGLKNRIFFAAEGAVNSQYAVLMIPPDGLVSGLQESCQAVLRASAYFYYTCGFYDIVYAKPQVHTEACRIGVRGVVSVVPTEGRLGTGGSLCESSPPYEFAYEIDWTAL